MAKNKPIETKLGRINWEQMDRLNKQIFEKEMKWISKNYPNIPTTLIIGLDTIEPTGWESDKCSKYWSWSGEVTIEYVPGRKIDFK